MGVCACRMDKHGGWLVSNRLFVLCIRIGGFCWHRCLDCVVTMVRNWNYIVCLILEAFV